MTPDEIKKKVENLTSRHGKATKKRDTLRGQLQAKKEELAALVKEIKAAGYDPKKLPEERDKKQAELEELIAAFEKDLKAVETALAEFEKK